jgi:tetratricopeptide (TPR) repeat protein
MSKLEIEKCLATKGNFIKIDYLTRFLKEDIPLDMKKFCYVKLGEVYETMKLFSDAAQVFNSLSIIAIAYVEKIKYHIKESKMYILAGNFEKADEAMKKAMNESNSVQREEIYAEIKNFYKKVAEEYEKETKRNHASIVYEKLLEMKISDSERQEIKKRLEKLYEKLGKKFDP